MSRQTLGVALHNGWRSYRSKGSVSQLGIALVSVFLVFSFALCTIFGSIEDRTLALNLLTSTTQYQSKAAVAIHKNKPVHHDAVTLVSTPIVSPTDKSTQMTTPTITPTNTSKPTSITTPSSTLTPTVIPSPPVTPIPTATPTPFPTATPFPTPIPTATPIPPPTLTITFTCATAVDYSFGQVCVHTLAGAALTITVVYCSGYSATSASLQGTSYADGSGNYTWYWTPETTCRGTATAFVNASWNGQSASNTDSFNVQ